MPQMWDSNINLQWLLLFNEAKLPPVVPYEDKGGDKKTKMFSQIS